MDLELVKARCFVCCPFELLIDKYLDLILENRINPEIGLNAGVLDRFKTKEFERVAKTLEQEGLRCTAHGPFIDLSIGAIDPKIRSVTAERLTKALEVSGVLGAISLVLHTGFDPRHHKDHEQMWLENAIRVLEDIVEKNHEHIPIMIENVYETDPAIHKVLFNKEKSGNLGFCLDFGHLVAFGKGDIDLWLEELRPFLRQLHLHDNKGDYDDHLPVGTGMIDFDHLFEDLFEHHIGPILTLEPHREEDVIPSLEALAKLLDRYPLLRPGHG